MEYYQRIRNAREDKDIKQYELANKINIKPKTYNLYENGYRSIPLTVLNNIINELNLTLDYVLGLTDKITNPNKNNINTKTLADNFLKYRKKLNYTQHEMSYLLNCNQQTLSEYERNKLKIPIETIKKFAQITNISSDTLTGKTTKEIKLKIPS